MLYNSSSFPLYTGRAGTMAMRTVCRESIRPRCRQCTRPDCPPVVEVSECADQESTGSSEDADLVPIHSGEDWIALLDDDLSQPSVVASDSFCISNLQKEDPVCITLSSWISSGTFPTWACVRNCGGCGIIVIT